MIKSLLLHLDGSRHTEQVIRLGVSMATSTGARIRGLTVVDTRQLDEMVATEAAVYATAEVRKLQGAQRRQATSHEVLDRATEAVGIDCDTLGRRGDPLQLLPVEAQFHDLVVTSHPPHDQTEAGELSAKEIVDLIVRGVQPMLVVRGVRPIERVLMVYDGTESSGRAIRSLLMHEAFPQADCRLLCVGQAADRQGRTLRSMAEYCRTRRPEIETGNLTGNVRKVLLPYAEKWQADLIVMGVSRPNRLFGRLFGQSALDVLRQSDIALYATV